MPIELGVARAKDLAHAAFAELLNDAVRPELLAGQHGAIVWERAVPITQLLDVTTTG